MSTRYRNVHCLIWNDDKFPFVSDDCKLSFFHLLTTPMSSPFGLYKASMGGLADEIRWNTKRHRNAIKDAIKEGFIKYDEKHHVILIPKFLYYNKPNGPNQLKSWGKIFKEIPNSPLKHEFIHIVKGIAGGMTDGMRDAMLNAFEMPCPIQEQEQEQEQEQDKLYCSSEKEGEEYVFSSICKNIVDFLNETCGTNFKSSSEKTKTLIKNRLNEGFHEKDFKVVIKKKHAVWIKDSKMCKFLRPETLFSNKFEGYLNEQEDKKGYF